MARLDLEAKDIEALCSAIKSYQGDAERVVNITLHEKAGQLINDEIIKLLPTSGRNWKGKKKAAKSSKPFTQENENLAVTIRTKPAYHYLYFPDDGSNTKRHAGGLDFMKRGAENKQKQIVDTIIDNLITKFEERT